jgi:hypothetical protein
MNEHNRPFHHVGTTHTRPSAHLPILRPFYLAPLVVCAWITVLVPVLLA